MSDSRKWRITIPRWDGEGGFQHYKHRDPIWLRVYTRLHSDDAYLELSAHLRGVLLGLWIEYARSGRDLAVTTATLTRRLNARVTTADLQRLNQAGFIELSLAPRKQDAPLEQNRVEQNREKGVKADRSEARGLSADKQNELNRILELAHDRDVGSWNVLYDAACGLPFAALAKVRESCLYEQATSGRVGVGYAVNALRSEPRTLRDAASFADFLEEEAS